MKNLNHTRLLNLHLKTHPQNNNLDMSNQVLSNQHQTFKQAIENKSLNRFQIHNKIDFNRIKVTKMKKTKRLLKKLKICPLKWLIESLLNETLHNNPQLVNDLHLLIDRLSQVNNLRKMTMNRNRLKNQMLWANESNHQVVLLQINLKSKNRVLQNQVRKRMILIMNNLKVKMLSQAKIRVPD